MVVNPPVRETVRETVKEMRPLCKNGGREKLCHFFGRNATAQAQYGV